MRRTGATMNQGQFELIVRRLDRIIILMEAQQKLAQASMAAVQEAVEGLTTDGATPATPKAPAKKGKEKKHG